MLKLVGLGLGYPAAGSRCGWVRFTEYSRILYGMKVNFKIHFTVRFAAHLCFHIRMWNCESATRSATGFVLRGFFVQKHHSRHQNCYRFFCEQGMLLKVSIASGLVTGAIL